MNPDPIKIHDLVYEIEKLKKKQEFGELNPFAYAAMGIQISLWSDGV